MDWLCKKRRPKNDVISDNLETEEEYQQRWASVRIIYFTMFLISLGFSIVLTGVWPYLDKMDPTAGKEFMGYIVGANPLGQMLFSPIFGYWGNKKGSIRTPLLISLAVFSLASSVYSMLEIFPSHAKWWMLGARFFVGVSSANIALCRSYLSAATRVSERTGAVSMVSLAQVLGFVVGPGLQAAVTPLGDHGVTLIKGVLTLNMYTAAGWLNVLLGIGNFILFLPIFFKEKRIAAKEAMLLQGKETEKETWASSKPDYISSWTLIVAFFVLVFNFVLLETLGTSLTMDQFAWTKTEALYYMGILMSAGAIIACLTFVGIGPLCRKFQERHVLLWGGFFLMVLGRAIYIPWGDAPPQLLEMNKLATNVTEFNALDNSNFTLSNQTMFTNQTILANQTNIISSNEEVELVGCPTIQEWCATTPAMTITQFIIGYVLTSVGYPIGVTLIQTIFSKILGPRPQGVWMGIMTGSGCLSRVMGPVFVSYIYTQFGTIWTFGITTVMMAVSMVWLWFVKDRLIVPDVDKQGVEMQPMVRNQKIIIKPSETSIATNGKV